MSSNRHLVASFANYFRRYARMPATRDEFNRWAQSLSPEDAAKLFAILHQP